MNGGKRYSRGPVTFKKKAYKNISECARAYSQNPSLVRSRLKNGWTLAQALGIEPASPRKPSSRNKIIVDGITYPNHAELARAYSVDPKLFRARHSKGWSVRQALNLDPSPKKRSWRVGAELIEDRAYPKGGRGTFKLYLIVCKPTGKEYVGVTTGSLEKRFGEHVSNARHHTGGSSKLYRAIRKHGPGRFSIKLLRRDAKNYKTLLQQEFLEVEKRNSYRKGLNSTPGGENVAQNRPIKIKGRTFVSFSAACDFFDVPDYLARSRLDSLGWTKEQAFGLMARPTDWGPKQIIINNKKYQSIKDACETLGKNASLVSGRLLKGWTTEQAFDLEALPEGHPPGQAKEILVQGKRFYSLSEASRHYRLKDSTVSARMRAGWSIEQAVGLLPPPKPKPHGKAVVVEGIRFPNLVAAANHYGVSSSLASDRLIKGWSNEEAFSIVPRLAPTRYGTIIKVNGLVFESVQAACKHFKVPYPTYKGRKKKGYTVKQALGLVEVKRINPVARPIMVKTIQYPSLKKACQAYKLPHSRVQARLSAGWTINEAFDLAPRKKVASQGTELKIKGRLFPSIKAACMYYGVSYPTFSVRRRSGYSVEESLINFRKKLPPNSKSITLKGKKYLSIADACRKLGLPRARVNSRLARGASTRQAFKEIYTP